MNNYIEKSDFKYSEIAIALEDYKFGSLVKFTIPTIMTFLSQDTIIKESHLNTKSNIVNKNPLGINKYTSCNYIELYVSEDKACDRTEGKKGDKYVVIFVGGNINNCIIIEPLL